MKWLLCGSEYIDDGMNFGFVYLIENLITGRKYIGRKYFTAAGYKQVNGKRKKIRKESDWKEYYGSNEELKEHVNLYGKDLFHREIMRLCTSKGEMSYFEAKYQFQYDVLESDQWYNTWIQCKVHKKHLTFLKKGV
jgi:hypothetical protein